MPPLSAGADPLCLHTADKVACIPRSNTYSLLKFTQKTNRGRHGFPDGIHSLAQASLSNTEASCNEECDRLLRKEAGTLMTITASIGQDCTSVQHMCVFVRSADVGECQ